MVLATADKRIKYVSRAYRGNVHDLTLLRAELPPGAGEWFGASHVHVDLGYQGIAREYAHSALSIPVKKPRGTELREGDKAANRAKSRERVVVEHAIGGMKRYRFLSDRLRCHRIGLYDTIVGIAAGLWNYNITC